MTLKVFLTDKYKEVNDTRIFDTLKARITVPQQLHITASGSGKTACAAVRSIRTRRPP